MLSIQDNGKGISDDALSQKSTLGLLGMKERARILGGSAEIRRGADGGTEVKIVLPISTMMHEEKD
jgi:two-component system sensor kinase